MVAEGPVLEGRVLAAGFAGGGVRGEVVEGLSV